ncbi:hypothetical protein GCM10027423_40130 [Spirosoma arcticum]
MKKPTCDKHGHQVRLEEEYVKETINSLVTFQFLSGTIRRVWFRQPPGQHKRISITLRPALLSANKSVQVNGKTFNLS